MYRKITAEFDSIESAEMAARAVKNNVKDIKEITIKSKKMQNENNKTFLFQPGNIILGGLNPYGAASSGTESLFAYTTFNGIDSDFSSKKNKRANNFSTATIEIICKNELLTKVNHTLTCYHGLKIKS